MRNVHPHSPVDLPLAAPDGPADGAAYFDVQALCRDVSHPDGGGGGDGGGWLICDDADAECWGLYRVGADGLSCWISDHPTRRAAAAAAAAAAEAATSLAVLDGEVDGEVNDTGRVA